MTIGEIGHYLEDRYHAGVHYRVVPMQGWKRKQWFGDTGLPWVLPSPNMPTTDTAIVYPGMCLLEGTNLSEGRGTTRPFELFGAPFIHPDTIVSLLREFRLPGVFFRPAFFQPTFQKHAGQLCGGAQIHVTDREKFRPFRTGVAVIKAEHNTYPRDFAWKQPPYEYVEVKMPIDILALALKEKIKWTHIPFEGGAPAVAALLGNHVEAASQTTEWKAHVEGGCLKLLAVYGEKRMVDFPNVPTLLELGQGITAPSLISIVGPKGLSPQAVETLHGAFKKAMEDPDFIKIGRQMDQPSFYRGPQDLAKHLVSMNEEVGTLIRSLGLRKE